MSRLDDYIQRMIAQRDCIDWAGELIADLPGPILEFGLGLGRTYDHLREVFPDREIFVFDREINDRQGCAPDDRHMILGDFADTAPDALKRIGGRAAMAHCDFGTADKAVTEALGAFLGGALTSLIRPGGLVMCSTALGNPQWERLALPPGVESTRFVIYRVADSG
jgi:hypothetical protein